MRKGYPVRVDVGHGGQQQLAAGARPPRRGGQALHVIFLLQLSPKAGMNPFILTNDRNPMAHVAHQFPQVAERLSLLARLETPGGVGQNPRYVTRTRPRKRGAAQTSHGRVSGESVSEDYRGGWSGPRV